MCCFSIIRGENHVSSDPKIRVSQMLPPCAAPSLAAISMVRVTFVQNTLCAPLSTAA